MVAGVEGLQGLPTWLQVLLSIAFCVGTAAAGVIGYTKKKLTSKTDDQKSQDTVVISAAFADSSRLDALSEAIRDTRDGQDRGTDATNRLNDTVNRLSDQVFRLADAIRGMKQ